MISPSPRLAKTSKRNDSGDGPRTAQQRHAQDRDEQDGRDRPRSRALTMSKAKVLAQDKLE